jgi:hypothetical protein
MYKRVIKFGFGVSSICLILACVYFGIIRRNKNIFFSKEHLELRALRVTGQGREANLYESNALRYFALEPRYPEYPTNFPARGIGYRCEAFDRIGKIGDFRITVSTNDDYIIMSYFEHPFDPDERIVHIIVEQKAPAHLKALIRFLADEKERGKSWTR